MHATTRNEDQLNATDPPVLVAILIAARRTRNHLLAMVARRELEERHGIHIRFARRSKEAAHAS